MSGRDDTEYLRQPSKAAPEGPVCPCSGRNSYHPMTNVCVWCGQAPWAIEEYMDPEGRYSLSTVQGDCVLREHSRWLNLSAALKVAEGMRQRRRGELHLFVGVSDENDPERGWLNDDDAP